MCGFAGFVTTSGLGGAAERVVNCMAATLKHRGPDDAGAWSDAEGTVAVGFRRLAIVDLTSAGHQPMVSPSGRYVMVFNGEVYNHQDIRVELAQSGRELCFNGHSDTETILAAIDHLGIEAAVTRFVGMFAIALWDRLQKRLYLLRDRIGVKPLYWGRVGNAVVFGSELKALRAFPGFIDSIDPASIAAFLRFGYVPAPASVYREVRKVPPGTIVSFNGLTGTDEQHVAYWSATDVARDGISEPFMGDDDAAIQQLRTLIIDSVRLRMVADVPVGVFLSGGVDSSTVAAVMQSLRADRVRTFSIGFSDSTFDEAPHAALVAKHLRTEHQHMYVSAVEAAAVVDHLPVMYDEPFADASQIPMFLVSRLARHSVSVCLSGDGGDELFGGYNRHVWAPRLSQTVMRLPRFVRARLADTLRSVSAARWDEAYAALARCVPARFRVASPGDKVAKVSDALGAQDLDELHDSLVSHWKTGAQSPRAVPSFINDPAARMMFRDMVTYLPDGVMVKVDRASMAVSLEAREPMLDHRIVEFAWRLPSRFKLRQGVGKWILRQVLYQYVPAPLVERPKMGFSVPLANWLRGSLRDWAEDLLSRDSLDTCGVLDADDVRDTWTEFLLGRSAHQSRIWNVLMLQLWMRSRVQPSANVVNCEAT